MQELEQYITKYFGVTRDDMAAITSFFHEGFLQKGEFFLKPGRVCDKLSFIRSGLVRVFLVTDEKEVTQWMGGNGYFITDLAGLTFGQASRWHIQALTDCELYSISGRDYNNLGHVIPKWHELEKLFIAGCFLFMETRITSLLSQSAEERYKILFEQQPELFNQVPLQYIASMLGMTPETLSRLRKKQVA
ncbi:MAG TPA: Crp/Fnr family transcriptional regulator [Flavipsychrobacter sp.]|nr:Crp/Fnr family transcriptional regulator [Flavipsychrobacter sp.]